MIAFLYVIMIQHIASARKNNLQLYMSYQVNNSLRVDSILYYITIC